MTNEKIYNVILRLQEKTYSEEIKWESTAQQERYLTTLGDYSIIIACDEAEGEYNLIIEDFFGDLIEKINNRELKSVSEDPYSVMKTLFVSARRNARGTEKAIDDILITLGK